MSPEPHIPEGSIIITPTEVYNEVRDLTEVVRQLVARDEADRERDTETRDKVTKISERLDAVEKKIWIFTGAAATLGGSLGAYLPQVLGK